MSTSDPFDSLFDFNDAAYDELIKDAERDDRVGDHSFLVTEVVRDQWPSGDPRLKVKGTLVTAGNAKADWTFSPPPPPDVVAAQKGTMERGMKMAIANSITMAKQLAQHYGVSPGKIKQGDEFKIKTAKNKEGFVRIIAFLPKDHAVGGQATTAAPTVGF